MTFFPVALGIGWLLHAFWDIGSHTGTDAHFVPGWYRGVCLGYDLILGTYLLIRTRAWVKQEGYYVGRLWDLQFWPPSFTRYDTDPLDGKSDDFEGDESPD
jgi:hypothetical protein